jgi:LysM repeat protein
MNGKSVLKLGESIKIPGAEVKTIVAEVAQPIDATLGIPTKPTAIINTTPMPAPVAASAQSPIKYTVAKGDNLYRLSKTYKTTEAQLMQWNGMKNDIVKPGQVMIVGMGASVGGDMITKKEAAAIEAPVPAIQKAKPTPHFSARDTTKTSMTIVKDSTTVAKKDTALANKPYPMTTIDTFKSTVSANPVPVIVDPKPIAKYAKYANEEGFYAGYFNRKNISDNATNGDASIFKSASGWEDKKYYVLINDINQGTIVRITANNKSICAKVMGPLPNIKEDLGLLARINAAAANALGIQDTRFVVMVNY